MKDAFLNGECAQLLSNKFRPKKYLSPKKKSVKKPISLVDIIKSKYVSRFINPGIHYKKKSSHVFNEICTEKFLNSCVKTPPKEPTLKNPACFPC